MEILSAKQIRAWDAYTIANEPVASIDLMERAAAACVDWLLGKPWLEKQFVVFCGKGNNGGDGIAIARMLHEKGYRILVYVLESGNPGSADFEINLNRLQKIGFTDVHFLKEATDIPVLHANSVIVDALFGTGLNKPLTSVASAVVENINRLKIPVVSIDLPSGLFSDRSSLGNAAVRADYTLTFAAYKLALLVQENADYVGDVHVLDIGLHPQFLHELGDRDELIDRARISSIYKPRNRFSHKGNFGHALVAGGSYGKMGAVVLSTKACLRTGAGLTTSFVPKCGVSTIQASAPEAMALPDEANTHLSNLPDNVERFSAVAFGPGTGTHTQTQHLLSFLLRRYRKPMVIDADGLNILSMNPQWLQTLPPDSILTPHPKEFDRLFGEHLSDFDRLATAREKAREFNCIVVLKGHRSFVATPAAKGHFNSTGNAGMAKGGSGDVLTGMIASLLAQGYASNDAAIFGVYLHGRAGDLAAAHFSQEAMLPGDLVDCIGEAFMDLARKSPH